MGVKQQEILRLISEEHLTQKEICSRLKMSKPRVSLIVKQLKQKGLISEGRFPQKMEGGGTPQTFTYVPNKGQQIIRLHGQILEVKILNSSQKYEGILKGRDMLEFEGHQIQLFPEKVVIHSYEGLEFTAPTAKQARAAAKPYWMALIGRLEKSLGVLALKPRNTRILYDREHYGYVNNELAKEAIARHEKLNFEAPEDGKIYLTADLSPGTPELETLHPKTALPDMEAFQPLFDDVRAHNRGITFTAFSQVIHDRIVRGENRIKEIEDYLIALGGASSAHDSEKLKARDTYFG
jgi:predicted transcriptional regulator